MLKADHFYEFGPFRLDPSERLLLRDDQPVPLAPKAFDTLLLLVENQGHLLTKEELLKRLWPETFVDEANLAQNISTVRRALGERGGGAHYIETVPKSGYRFIPETRSLHRETGTFAPAAGQRAAAGTELISTWQRSPTKRGFLAVLIVLSTLLVGSAVWRWRGSRAKLPPPNATGQIRSIAVLPLLNLSAEPDQEYFSDGLTDELITQLAQLGALRVISRTSVMHYKHSSKSTPEIGNELQVDSIVEGSVERANGRVRIRIQLIRAATDQHIWAETYDRDIKDVFQVERDVAREIAQQIGLRSLPPAVPKHTIPPESHEYYLRGRYHWNRRNEEGLQAAIAHYQKAIELDPLYAQAYAGLADSYTMLANWGFIAPVDGYPKAQAAARKALELDGRLAEAEASLAYANFFYDWDWPGAEARFRRALELNPSYGTARHSYSVYLMAAGRHSEAQQEIERARELDPLSPIINSVVGWIYYQGRRYDKAIEQSQRTIEMNPNYAPSLLDLGSVYLAQGEHKKALELFRRARAISGDTATCLSYLAQGFAQAGRKAEANDILRELQGPAHKFVSPWELALIHNALGEKDRALAYLERAADQHAGWIVTIGTDPRFDDLRGEPKFRQLQVRVRIPVAAANGVFRR